MSDRLDDLARLREGWDEVHAFEASLDRPRSLAESVGEYMDLCTLFAGPLRETEALFESQRARDLAAWQARLRRLPPSHGAGS